LLPWRPLVELVALILVFVAFLCFLAGAVGVVARVNWDAAGKASLTLAALAQWGPWGR
jgi:hypothetical protein